MRIYVAGIGPGSAEDITPALQQAVADSNVVVGYKYYFQFIEKFISDDTVCIDTGMKKNANVPRWPLNMPRRGIPCVWFPAAMPAYMAWLLSFMR